MTTIANVRATWEGHRFEPARGWVISCSFRIANGERGYDNRVEAIISDEEYEIFPHVLCMRLHEMIETVRDAARLRSRLGVGGCAQSGPALAPNVTIRFADSRDHNAILSSWLRSYLDDKGPQISGVHRDVFFDDHQRIVKNLIGHGQAEAAAPDSIVLVACDPEDDKHLFSWLCAELTKDEVVLHYAFTFQAFRRFGLARRLVNYLLQEQNGRKLIASHRTRTVRDLLEKNSITFNPYRIPT